MEGHQSDKSLLNIVVIRAKEIMEKPISVYPLIFKV